MRISKKDLLKKIEQIDARLMNLWLSEHADLNDDDIWEIFVVLLESRVELLNVCMEAKVPLTPEICMPEWLEKLTNSRKEMRLHELKKVTQKTGKSDKYRLYENMASVLEENDT
ncbi:MAG: hypothetical protein ABIR96_03390 [Bdellovibrionota bacterium]